MTPREKVLQQALALSPQDRAFVAAALEESLSALGPSPAISSPDFVAELQRRSAAFRAGEMWSAAATGI